jgi:hypothetical protein
MSGESHPSEGELPLASERSDATTRCSISFSTIGFHEHAMFRGDNPSTTAGPSIEIDWTEQSHTVLNIEEYESMRYPRRKKNQLIMPGQMRTSVLLGNGYTLRESSISKKLSETIRNYQKLSETIRNYQKPSPSRQIEQSFALGRSDCAATGLPLQL